jgi:hypothetical protein
MDGSPDDNRRHVLKANDNKSSDDRACGTSGKRSPRLRAPQKSGESTNFSLAMKDWA